MKKSIWIVILAMTINTAEAATSLLPKATHNQRTSNTISIGVAAAIQGKVLIERKGIAGSSQQRSRIGPPLGGHQPALFLPSRIVEKGK